MVRHVFVQSAGYYYMYISIIVFFSSDVGSASNEHDFEGPLKIMFDSSASTVGKSVVCGGKQLGNGKDGELMNSDFTMS